MTVPSDSPLKLYLAPLQGYTDAVFRTVHASLFGGQDASFSPFIESHRTDPKMFRDVEPEKNKGYRLIPQLLGNKSEEMIPVLQQLVAMGYQEVNWNLGCPYRMVTKREMGAGLLTHSEQIDCIMNDLFRADLCKISVKMRLGLEKTDEWKPILPVLNRYPLSEVIVHARSAEQMYKGVPDVKMFKEFASGISHPVGYNGDLFSLENYLEIQQQLPGVTRWMSGRGIFMNPLLFKEIRTGKRSTTEAVREAISQLHGQLLYHYGVKLSGSSHLLNKVKPYWEYFAPAFSGKEKGLKKIKKAHTLEAYERASKEIFRD